MRMALRILILLTLCVTACSGFKPLCYFDLEPTCYSWTSPPDVTEEQMAQDENECFQEVVAATWINEHSIRSWRYEQCMEARGYTAKQRLSGGGLGSGFLSSRNL